jgi:purine-binding chemotaxis protein CheW
MNEAGTGIDWEEVKARLRKSQLALEKALTPDPARTEALFRERAAQLARRGARADAGPAVLRVLTFALGAERYGVEFADVQELLPFARCTPIPGAPAGLLGVINVHGEIQSVVDLGRLMEIPEPEVRSDGTVLLLRKGVDRVALRVDRLDKVQTLTAAELAVPDKDEARYVRGLAADRLRVLSTDAILAHPLFQSRMAP